MGKDWTMVRIERDTRARLEEIRDILWRAHARGQRQLELDARDRCSLDQVIGILCDHYLAHRERSQRSRGKPKGAGPGATPSADQVEQQAGDQVGG